MGCGLDEEWSLQAALPATVAIANETTDALVIDSLASTEEASGGFFLDPGAIDPGTTATLRVQERTFAAVRAGHFVLEGTCGGTQGWQRDGRHVLRGASATVMYVRLRILVCGPPRLPPDTSEPALEVAEPRLP
jgi:hypothetical protein